MGGHTSFVPPVAGAVGPGLSQDPARSASCPWPWWKEVGRTPCDTLWVTEGGGQPTTGSRGNLRLVCQSGSVSGVVSGVKLKVRPSQIHLHANMALGVLHCWERDPGARLAEEGAAQAWFVPLLGHGLPACLLHVPGIEEEGGRAAVHSRHEGLPSA